MKENARIDTTIYRWIIHLIFSIDKKTIWFWMILNGMLCVLPAVALLFNRKILEVLGDFLSTGSGVFADVMPYIVLYGVILTISGLSTRLNSSFLYFRMYDSYYLGLQEVLMDFFQKMPMELLFKKEINDEYNAIIRRAGALTDVTSASCSLIGKGVGVIALLFTAASVSPFISLFIVIYIGTLLFINRRMTKKLEEFERSYAPAERRLREIKLMPMEPNAAKEIRVYGTQKRMMEQFDRYYDDAEKSEVIYNKSVGKAGALSSLLLYVFMGIILVLCLRGILNGTVTVEDFLMILTLCGSLAGYVSVISQSSIDLHRGVFALKRQWNFMNMVDEEIECRKRAKISESECANEKPARKAEVAVKTENLCFAYGNGKEVLHNINLTIPKGQVVALVGENGGGKSTLVQVIMGIYEPTGGKAYCNGTVGTFFQDFFILHKTVRENIGMGDVENIENRQMVQDAIKKGGAEELVEKLPKKMDTLLRREVYPDGAELSGGERQKVGISRSLMGQHDILIFDEPASALDPIAELNQFKSIKENLKDSTAILISHRIGFARLADRILVMDRGRIVEDGTHEELIAEGGLYAEMYRQQASWYKKEA